ncbi:hypothetical protein [Sinomicrobium soli]|uniref:hypothetical protein n=1 Tax=Sinomicrobium sp. N-1-3-6 TaxID=2219864 RepID=UPI0011BF438B|nr:hypothetical protein [Sinomicrobium sp. N-1-3-6]
MATWKALPHNLYILCFLILFTACKSKREKNLATVADTVLESNEVFLQELHPGSKVDQNGDIVRISYTQPDLVFYLFKNEELAFVEFPPESFNNVNLDFFYNVSLEQIQKEIHFFGREDAEWVTFPTMTEEVFAYELYKINQNKLESSGYYSPVDFDFDFNDFESKKILISEDENQLLIYLVGNKDTIVCKKTSEIDFTGIPDQEVINKMKDFKSGGNSENK